MKSTKSTVVELPLEILTVVFELLSISSPRGDLVNSLLCCKTWQSLVEPVLYKDVVLGNLNLPKFLSQSPRRDEIHIHSLTIRLQPVGSRSNPYENQDDFKSDGCPEAKEVWHQLDVLSSRVKSMIRMSSISVVLADNSSAVIGFWLARSTLARLVDNLPPSCTSLEIDAREDPHLTQSERGHSGSGHLCPSIRRVMPQLNYLRLRLRSVCPEICGVGFNLEQLGEVTEGFKAVEAPHLKQMVVNLCILWGIQGPVCHSAEGVSDPHHPSETFPEARKTIAKYLRHAFESSCYPEIERLWIVDLHWKGRDDGDNDSYPAYFRRDISLKRTQVFPYKNVGLPFPMGKQKAGSMIRMSDDDYVTPTWVHEFLVEGECWQESMQGVRLPAPVMASSLHILKELPKETFEEWTKRTKISSQLRANEALAGRRVLEVGDIDGLTEVYNVKEIVPQGFKRNEALGMLERI